MGGVSIISDTFSGVSGTISNLRVINSSIRFHEYENLFYTW